MTKTRFTLDLDSAAGLVTTLLLLSLAVVVFVGAQLGVRATAQWSATQPLGPYEALTLTFSEPVDESLVIEKFFIQPEVRGKFEWVDDQTLRFVPLHAMLPDTEYTLALSPGFVTPNGRAIKKPQSWKFRTRAPQIVYLTTQDGTGQLWSIDTQGGEPVALTDNTLKIFNFDTARNGEFIIFAAFNDQNGIDLWRVQRTGGNPLLVLQCGPDRCSVPAISPDGRMVAYVREAASPTDALNYGSPRIWVVNLETRANAPLYEDSQIIGYGPVWSPDGTRLSSYDGIQDEIRLLDLITSEQMIIPTQLGSPVTWSGDAGTFVYTDIAGDDTNIVTRIHQARIALNELSIIFGDNDVQDYGYNALAWSPRESKLVIGLRPLANDPSMALWLMDPYTRDGQVIVDQPGYAYSTPLWDPWGGVLLFQQFKLKGVYTPEIAIWMPGFDQPRVLAQGLLPHWLP